MVDVFLVIVCIVMTALLAFLSFYIMLFYSHADQPNTLTTILCKVIIVATLIQCCAQELILSLDAANSRGTGSGFNMTLIWEIFYLSMFANLGFIIPFSIFVYESDDEKSCCERISITICQLVISVGVVCVLTFVSYIYFNTAQIPIEVVTNLVPYDTMQISSTNVTIINVSDSSVDMNIQIGLPYYIMGIMCFFGYWVLVLCGGCGLSALPLDLILQFRMRPIWRKTSEANAKKAEFQAIVKDLVKAGERLKKKMKQSDYESGWWSRRKYNNKVMTEFSEYQQLVIENNQRYELFKLELQMQNTNPLVYIGKLILGIIGIFISMLWWFTILFTQLVDLSSKPTLKYMIDNMLIYLENNNANFASVILYSILTQYLVFCILKGSFTFGVSIPFVFSFHPMKYRKTWMNSFLFNLCLCLLGCTAIVHMCVSCYPQYMRNTVIQIIFVNQINHLKFFKVFFEKKVFVYMFLIWSGLISFFIIIRGVKQPDLLTKIEQKRKKLNMNPVEIQLTDLNAPLKDKSVKSARSKVTVKKRGKEK